MGHIVDIDVARVENGIIKIAILIKMGKSIKSKNRYENGKNENQSFPKSSTNP